MAMSLNRAQLIGNLTRDPEIKQIPGGAMVASFSIATNSTWKDASGNKQEKAEYHNIVAWRNLADICSQYLKKGSKIYVEGRIQTRDWEGEDGVKRYRTEIVSENIIMLDRKGGFGDEGPFAAGQSAHGGLSGKFGASDDMAIPQAANLTADEVAVDDLPF